jgi:hypothetical protein
MHGDEIQDAVLENLKKDYECIRVKVRACEKMIMSPYRERIDAKL